MFINAEGKEKNYDHPDKNSENRNQGIKIDLSKIKDSKTSRAFNKYTFCYISFYCGEGKANLLKNERKIRKCTFLVLKERKKSVLA